MTTIGFLHTSAVHVPTFRALLAELAPGWRDVHVVEPPLLTDPRGLDGFLRELADAGADVIVCTCSTLGPARSGALPSAKRERRWGALRAWQWRA